MKPEDFLKPEDRLKLARIRRNIERLEREVQRLRDLGVIPPPDNANWWKDTPAVEPGTEADWWKDQT